MINDVIIKKLQKFEDERGWLSEIWRTDELEYNPVMGYVSFSRQGVVRGPHEHRKQSDCFVFAGPGDFEMYLWENREGRVNYRKMERMLVGESNPTLIIVPPGVVHGYKCVSPQGGYYVNLPDRLYKGKSKSDQVDEIRWEADPDSPFKIH